MSTSLEAKVVVLGSQNVGKTSLVHRFVHSSFLPPTTPSTVGASFLTTRVHDAESDTTIRLQLWDTAGQERFRSISRLYYRGAHAAVLCYDITSKKSFDEMGVWLRELRDKANSSANEGNDEVILHIVGTKSDVVANDPTKREVPFERCIDFVAQELYPDLSHSAHSAGNTQHNTRPSSAAALRSSTSPPLSSSHNGGLQTTSHSHKNNNHNGLTNGVAGAPLLSPPSNRSSGVWFWDTTSLWDCCHEISAKDGEGIEEVFRVITRKLVEQHTAKLERQRAIEATVGVTPGLTNGGGGGGNGSGGAGGGYFDLPGNGHGSFRLGHGDKRRSWLGLGGAVTPGALSAITGGVYEEEDERDVEGYRGRRGRCC